MKVSVRQGEQPSDSADLCREAWGGAGFTVMLPPLPPWGALDVGTSLTLLCQYARVFMPSLHPELPEGPGLRRGAPFPAPRPGPVQHLGLGTVVGEV